jgi:arginase family enzyme
MAPFMNSVWLAVDDAWDFLSEQSGSLPPRINAVQAGKSLRFLTSKPRIEQFYRDYGREFRPYTLSGSGDFHHLTALLVRQFSNPFVIVSFDNHPDWDIRPPHWCCGAWINRALENPLVERIAVWGCGSFECLFPGRLLGNSRACKRGRLKVVPWAKENRKYPVWLSPMTSASWREKFTHFAKAIAASDVYVTIDLDCLVESEAVTNWENGSYSISEISWAINQLRKRTNIVGGDLCGASSSPRFAGWFQRFASKIDHPKDRRISVSEQQSINREVFSSIWPALTEGDKDLLNPTPAQ